MGIGIERLAYKQANGIFVANARTFEDFRINSISLKCIYGIREYIWNNGIRKLRKIEKNYFL